MVEHSGASGSGSRPQHDERVKVYVRCRPADRNRCVQVAERGGNHVEVRAQNGVREFLYDGVFSDVAKQHEVYEAVGLPVLEQVMQGFNGCILAYGPTGSGKTYSLLEEQGEGMDQFEGVLPRVVKDMFSRIAEDQKYDYDVTACAVQIYNENLICLLSKQEKLDLHEGEAVGAKWYSAKSAGELLEIFEKARANIHYAETKLNQHSSRAHAIMRIQLQRRDKMDGERIYAQTVSGTLTIVDLAGSERQKKSMTKGERFEEAKHINTSLLALGKVVKALVDKTHPPFRDSKLTRILSSTLGGNATTRLLVCVSPAVEHCTETISACEFGKRAMDVVQKIHVNVETTMRTTDEVSGESRWVAVTEELKLKLRQEQEAKEAAQRETAMVAANVRQISEAYAQREDQIREDAEILVQDALQAREQHYQHQYTALADRFTETAGELQARTKDLVSKSEELDDLKQQWSVDKRELTSVWEELQRLKTSQKHELELKEQENLAFQAKNDDNQARIKVLSSQLSSLQGQLNHQQEVLPTPDVKFYFCFQI